MYLEKNIQHWTNENWTKFFEQFPHFWREYLYEEREEIFKEIKTILRGSKKEIEANFERLYELKIINGIGPYWFPRPIRFVITWAFKYFRWEWHDLMGAIGGTERDRKESDVGMLKYTFKSIFIDIEQAIKKGNILRIIYKCTLSLYVRSIVSLTFYILVRLFGRFGSFRYDNPREKYILFCKL